MDNEQKRKDVFTLLKMLKEITKKEPKIWSKLLLELVNTIINIKVGEKESCSEPEILQENRI